MQLTLWTDPDRSGVKPLPQPRRAAARPRRSPPVPQPVALAAEDLGARADRYIQEAHAEATRKAYQGDWDAFTSWCQARSLCALPAAPRTLELYLTHLAELGRKASTIRRARIAIGLAHGHAELARPDRHARVRALERGIGRMHGTREEGAPPLLEHELAAAVQALGSSAREDRDRALLLLGFAGAFRASDLAGLDIADVRFTPDALVVDLRRSKEDQLGRGARTEIPRGRSEATCPVRALQRWLERVGRPQGPLFRVVAPGGIVEHQRIHPRAVSRALQRAAARAGLAGAYSSHSLRKGLATSAYLHGATPREIQLHGRWKDPRSVDRYIQLEHVPGRRNVAQGLF